MRGDSKKWLTIISLGCKFLIGAFVVFLPKFLVSSSVFGDYAKWLSVCLIGTYVLDFGVSLRGLTFSRVDEESSKKLLLFAMSRDLILLSPLCLLAFFFGLNEFFVVLACILGANIFGAQSVSRALGDYGCEFSINSIQLLAIFAFFAVAFFCKLELQVSELLVGLLVVPRFLGFIFAFRKWLELKVTLNLKTMLETLKFGVGREAGLLPYALQGVIVASATNVDVILASLVLPSYAVGEIKLITTVIGLFVVVPEMVANYKLNRMANLPSVSYAHYWKLFFAFGLAFSVLSVAFFTFLREGFSSVLSDYWVVFCLGGVVALRIGSLALANFLTLIGRQGRRVWVMLIVNICYWSGLLLMSSIYESKGFVIALLTSSLLQTSAYAYLVKKYE